jgi:hypothetical protein
MNDPAQSSIREGDWVHVLTHQATGKVIEKSFLWGNSSFRVWLPSTDSIIRFSRFTLDPFMAKNSRLSLEICKSFVTAWKRSSSYW